MNDPMACTNAHDTRTPRRTDVLNITYTMYTNNYKYIIMYTGFYRSLPQQQETRVATAGCVALYTPRAVHIWALGCTRWLSHVVTK
jgi:hypothetical protein